MNPRLTIAAGAATVLASLSLYPLLWGPEWFWAGFGAVLVAGVAGALTRLRTFPAALCFAAAVAGVFLYLNAVFAGSHSWAGLVPTGPSLQHLGHLVTQARSEIHRNTPPVPDNQGVMLAATAGIGVVAAITDLLAVRLRRPALAGLPLLVLFCVPLTTDAKPGWAGGTFVFTLGMAGYLGLLSADARDRLRLWGRLVHRWQDDTEGRGPDTRPLTAAGRRIGLAAVVLAVVLPLLVPGLKPHRLFSGSGGNGRHGDHVQISLPNPLDELNNQLKETQPQVVLTYRSNASTPPYLQVYVLNQLGTNAWTMTAPKATDQLHKGVMPAIPGLTQSTTGAFVRETITLGNNLTSGGTHLSYLPVPYPARSVSVPGDWRVDPDALTVLSAGANLAGLRYTVTSDEINPPQANLRHAPAPPPSLDGYLGVPRVFKSLTALARRVTAGSATAFGKALALQAWFRSPRNFTYSLRVPPPDNSNALIQFLTKSKSGYCQQFAFGMAVLARLLGIPSRVVVGYTHGTQTGPGTWQVKTSDAHAWPELYFTGFGWLRFEPTPTGAGGQTGQGTATVPSYTIPQVSEVAPILPGPSQTPGGASPGPTSPSTGPISKLQHPGGPGGTGAGHRHGSGAPVAIMLLAVLAALLIAPRLARFLTRRLRWWRAAGDVMRAHAAWCEVRDDLTDYRFEYRPSESPRALAQRVAGTLGLSSAQHEALERIARAEERASYAVVPADSATLARDVATVRRAIAHASPVTGRCSAALFPLSALAPARAALQNALDVFGWIDVITTKLRRPRRKAPALSH